MMLSLSPIVSLKYERPGRRCLLLLLFLPILWLAGYTSAAVKTVCDAGCDHASIKAAIPDTTIGDTILVQTAKTYNEFDLNVSGRILISDGGPTSYIINGSGCKNNVLAAGANGVVEGFTITGCQKTDGQNGAGIVSNGNTQLNNVVIEGNSTTGSYAGIWHTGGGTLTIRNSEIKNNTAVGMPAMSSVAPNLRIFNLKVMDNVATGPLSFGSVSILRQVGLTAHIDGLEMSGNTATATNIAGGALYIGCNGGSRKVGIFNSTISNNTATATGGTAHGGGVNIASCEADIVATTVSGNTLINTSTTTSKGGGYYTSNAGRDIRFYAGSSITGNTSDSGGGVWCASGRWQIGGAISGNTQSDTDFVNGNNSCGTPGEIGTSQPESGTSGDPVNTFTGELFNYLPPDIQLGGLIPVEFSRFYNSSLEAQGYRGALGRNWLHTFEFFLEFESEDIIKILTPFGREIKFYRDIDDKWVRLSPAQVHYQLVEFAGNLVLYDPESRYQYTFDGTSDRVVSIGDANGNSLTLGYTGSDLTSVDDGLGRSLTLTYDSGLLQSVTGGNKSVSFTQNTSPELLTFVDALGKTTTYSYNTSPDGLLVAATRPEMNVPFTQSWDLSSRVTSQMDGLGNSFQYGYAEGVTSITDPAGDTTSHLHNGSGVLTEAKDEAGQSTTVTADSNNNRQGIADQLGNDLTVNYDLASGNVSSIRDAENNLFSFTYVARNLDNGIVEYDLTRADYPDGSFELWVYDSRGNISQYTDLAEHAWVYTYNDQGNRLTETNPVGGVTTYTYLADGSLDTETDPAGNLVDRTYDTEGRLSLLDYADGTKREFLFDSNDRMVSEGDENTTLLARTFNDNGNLIAASDGASVSLDFGYDAQDRLNSIAPAVGDPGSITYDAKGRISVMSGPDGNSMSWVYDSRGRTTSVSDSAGLVWAGTYDNAGRLLTVADALDQTTSFEYDSADRPVQVTDAAGTVQQFEYDGLDRILSATVAGRTTTFDYDARGLPVIVAINGTISSGISYDELGHPVGLTDAAGNEWTFGYDNSGRTIAATDPLLQTTAYGFDNRNRHNHTVFPNSLGTLDITHDGRGQITALNYSDGTALAYAYDAPGSLLSGNSLLLTRDALGRVLNSNGITNTRDGAGRLSTTTLADGTLTYNYDVRGQFTSVQDWLGGDTSLTYDAAGRLATVTYANGLVTTYSYNAVNAITAIETTNGASVMSRLDFTRNALGEITTANRTQPVGTPELRPRSNTIISTFDAAMQHQAFTYDAMGRRTLDERYGYIWNLASRLLQYNSASGGAIVSLGYDGLGNIVSSDDGTGARAYIWNHATETPCIAEMSNTVIQYNVCAPDGSLIYSITSNNERWYYHYDEMGNVHFVTDDNGDVLAVYRYSPFGVLLGDSSGGTLENPFTYQGRSGVLAEGDGLYVFQSRVYDSYTATFLSRDPVTGFDPATANPYQFALNNPLLYIDRDGGQSVKPEDIFGGGVGAYAAIVDDIAGKIAGKLDKAVSILGKSSGPGKIFAKNAANLRTQTGRLSKLGVAAWVISAYQEIDSTNDKVKRTISREEKQLQALLSAYVGMTSTVNELYKQKKLSYHRWRAWLQVIERQYQEGIESAVRGSRLEVAQDALEGALKAVGSVILPPNATDSMFRWMGRNLPASDTVTNTLTDWSAN